MNQRHHDMLLRAYSPRRRATKRPRVDFAELASCAARFAGATIRWRESMRLDVTPEEVAEAARELSWRHPEARKGGAA
jgi:hypothetical protein